MTRRTFNIDPTDVAAKITPRTRGIIPVHLYGHPADMDPLLALAEAHGLFVLEDAAEALGAAIMAGQSARIGNCATFSFFGNKIITTGEGGMVTTNDDELRSDCAFFAARAWTRSDATGFLWSATTIG